MAGCWGADAIGTFRIAICCAAALPYS